jgi:dihydroorotase
MGEKRRKGDIYTHYYSGLHDELLSDGKLNPGMWAGRKPGVIFDVGHGGSFAWRVAVPAIQQGFLPDSISTDLHIASMNTGMKPTALPQRDHERPWCYVSNIIAAL